MITYLRAPQGCLRSSCANLREKADDLDSPGPLSTPSDLRTHPRGCPTIHLSKSIDTDAIGRFRGRCRDSLSGSLPDVRQRPVRGGGILSSLPPLSTGCCEDFSAFAQPDVHLEPLTYRLSP